jgi:hypothetical protein
VRRVFESPRGRHADDCLRAAARPRPDTEAGAHATLRFCTLPPRELDGDDRPDHEEHAMQRDEDAATQRHGDDTDETSAEKPMPIVTPEGPPPEDERDDD